jgi:class 3 adenylate cyclase/tetratricopeptide (TPR) repeat protein
VATCTTCSADNPADARFCSTCGEALTTKCPACGANASGRFCNSCGVALTPTSAGATATVATSVVAPRSGTAASRVAERRITSVLFGDLVGFTPLSETRDAEDVRELLSRYFSTARTVIERYGGTVEKFIGDAVMAVWGVPAAHEDDAERAVRAGIDLVDAVAQLSEAMGIAGLTMRVGIVTGEVAVTLGASGEGMVAGDAVNTAARVQAAAAPGQVWVDDATRAATSAAVMYDAQGLNELKGKQEAVPLFAARQVVAAVGGARRVDGLEAPFTGRDRELRLVKELYHAAIEERRPRLVTVFGPAGVGKTRLAWEMDKYTDGLTDAVYVYRGRCLSYGEGVAFWALAEMVRSRLDILEDDDAGTAAVRLREGLATFVPDDEERAWLTPRVGTLIGLSDGIAGTASYPRDDLFAAWRTFFERVAEMSDAVGAFLRIDDLQWADAGLLDFLEYLVDSAKAPIFLLTLARTELTEVRPAFGTGRRATAIHLEPLPEPVMESIIDGLVAGLPSDVRSTLVERAEGVPLFAVETVRALIDRDAVIPREGRYVLADDAADRIDLTRLALPNSLHTLIAARLDGLPEQERQVILDAAVLGQSFSREGLEAVHRATGGTVDIESAAANLVRKEILGVDTDPRSSDRGHYHFVQALVRTVAYDMLSRRDRKARHLAAAEFLLAEPDADAIPALIAAHFVDAHAAAGQDEDAAEIATAAIERLSRAAAHARDLGAPAEARRHLGTALELVTDDLMTARLTEQAARAATAMASTSDALTLADRCRAIYDSLGMEVDAGRALALWGEIQIAAGIGAPVIEPLVAAYHKLEFRDDAAAETAQLALQVARAHYLSIGDAASSIPWFDRAVILGEALEDLPLLAATLSSYAGALVLVGRSRMGIGLLRVALDLARTLDSPAVALRPLNNLVSFMATRDLTRAKEYATEALTLVRRVGDREIGNYVAGSAAHVLYNSGEWDALIELGDEMIDLEVDYNSIAVANYVYVAAVQSARGRPTGGRDAPPPPEGVHADLLVEASKHLVAAFLARGSGDFDRAAAASFESVRRFTKASGIDDDFALYWLAALDNAIEVKDVDAAQRLLNLVEEAPRGHVSPLVRALRPWLRAQVQQVADADADIEAEYIAAETALAAFGAPFYLARARLDHARWLQSQGRGAEAWPLLDEAESTFEQLGATPFVELAQQGRALAFG